MYVCIYSFTVLHITHLEPEGHRVDAHARADLQAVGPTARLRAGEGLIDRAREREISVGPVCSNKKKLVR
jgi:hypothetical protein